MIRVSIDGRDLQAAFKAFADKVEAGSSKFLGSFSISAGRKAKSIAWDLTRRRLPSGGGSYIQMFETKKSRSKYKAAMLLDNTHEWAKAVEYGTEEHDIVSSADFNKGKNDADFFEVSDKKWNERGYYSGRKGFFHGTRARSEIIKGGLRILSRDERINRTEKIANVFGKTVKSGIGKQRLKAHEKYQGKIGSGLDTSKIWYGRTERVSGGYASGGGMLPSNMLDVMKLNDKQIEAAEKMGTPTTFAISRKYLVQEYRKNKGLPKWVADLSDEEIEKQFVMKTGSSQAGVVGADISPEYLKIANSNKKLKWTKSVEGGNAKWGDKTSGMKYEEGEWFAGTVKHPGARAFEILNDTKKEMEKPENIIPIINTAWKNAMRRIGQ